ncbi:hypothetical protein [Sulfitobacter sp. 915]|uniref:hypothetical protein n=1 Tax=Sulfitobacter sp. 915 TaxID=3368558 RepID=UPI0037462EFF
MNDYPRADWGLKRLNRAAARLRSDLNDALANVPIDESLIDEARDELEEIETEIKRRGDAAPTQEQAQDDMICDQENRAN